MNQLGICGGIIVQNNRCRTDSFRGQCTEYQIIFCNDLSVKGVGFAIIIIVNGRISAVRTRSQNPGYRNVIGRLLHAKIIQFVSS